MSTTTQTIIVDGKPVTRNKVGFRWSIPRGEWELLKKKALFQARHTAKELALNARGGLATLEKKIGKAKKAAEKATKLTPAQHRVLIEDQQWEEANAAVKAKSNQLVFPANANQSRVRDALIKKFGDEIFDGGASYKADFFDSDKKEYVASRVGQLMKRAFNTLFHGTLTNARRFYDPFDTVVLTITRLPTARPTDYKLRDSVSGNCVIDAVRKSFDVVPDIIEKRIAALCVKYNINAEGVNKETMLRIGRSVRRRIVVISPTGAVWSDTGSKEKKITVFASAGHAEQHTPLAFLSDCKVDYSGMASVDKLHCQKRYFLGNNCSNPNGAECRAVQAGCTLYKQFRPSTVTQREADDQNPAFFDCFTAEQCVYRKWRSDGNYRALTGVYFDIFKNADVFLTAQKFEDHKRNTPYHLYDMNRAYPSFKSHPLYKKYLIVTGFVSLYDVTNTPVLSVLDNAGVSFVQSITWHHEFVGSTGWVQAGRWHNNIVLFTVVTEGWAEVKLSAAALCSKPEDIFLPFTDSKRENNKLIGKLISGASVSAYPEVIKCGTVDLEQVTWEYKTNPMCESYHVVNCKFTGEDATYDLQRMRDIGRDGFTPMRSIGGHRKSVYVVGMMKASDKRSQLHQIHGCILAYQQTTFMKAMVDALKWTRIISYNVDGFHTTDRAWCRLSDQPGGFKHEIKPIRYHASCTPSVDNAPFNVSLISAHDWCLLPWAGVDKSITLITGPAGCGKSYKRIELYPGVENIVCCPTNSLVHDTQQRTTATVQTYHKFFGLWTDKNGKPGFHIQTVRETVIVDELPMLPAAHIRSIVDQCRLLRMNLVLIGDVRKHNGVWITDQMLPIGDDGDSINVVLKDLDFTHIEEISNVRRQNAFESAWIDSLRGMKKTQMVAACTRVLTTQSWKEVITCNITGVATRHKICREYNKDIVDTYGLTSVLARRISTKKVNGVYKEGKGSLSMQPIDTVWCDRQHYTDETPNKMKYELAYFRTVNAVQGQSFPMGRKYVISLAHVSRRFLYVAVSRCRQLDDIILVL